MPIVAWQTSLNAGGKTNKQGRATPLLSVIKEEGEAAEEDYVCMQQVPQSTYTQRRGTGPAPDIKHAISTRQRDIAGIKTSGKRSPARSRAAGSFGRAGVLRYRQLVGFVKSRTGEGAIRPTGGLPSQPLTAPRLPCGPSCAGAGWRRRRSGGRSPRPRTRMLGGVR